MEIQPEAGITLSRVLAWMEKQEPYALQAVLAKSTALLGNTSLDEGEDQVAPSRDPVPSSRSNPCWNPWKTAGEPMTMTCERKGKEGKDVTLKEINKEALLDINEPRLEEFKKKQLDLFGGDSNFLKTVDQSLKDLKESGVFLAAQKLLFKYRKSFFLEHFGDFDGGDFWFTDGSDDTHHFEVIPFQVTQNFEELMKLASSNRKIKKGQEAFYFENSPICDDVNHMFGKHGEDFY